MPTDGQSINEHVPRLGQISLLKQTHPIKKSNFSKYLMPGIGLPMCFFDNSLIRKQDAKNGKYEKLVNADYTKNKLNIIQWGTTD